MKDGTFRTGSLAFGTLHKLELLMNGQHQLEACRLSGVAMSAAIERYLCHEEADVWKLFASFDTQRMRSERNVMQAAKGLFDDRILRECPLHLLAMCGSALFYLGGDGIRPNFRAHPINKSEKVECVCKYATDVHFIHSFGTEVVDMLKVPIVTAMIVTHRIAEKKARQFWERVLVGDGLVRGSPQWHLNKVISNGVGHRNGGQQAMDAMYNACIAWWNSYANGDNRRIIRLGAIRGVIDAVAGE
jgi:hypothetical protein